MPTVTGNTHKFKSQKISGQLYVDNEVSEGIVTEVGLDFDEAVTFDGVENVKRVSMIVNHTSRHPCTYVARLIEGEDSGKTIHQFEHTRDKEVWQWILDRIDP